MRRTLLAIVALLVLAGIWWWTQAKAPESAAIFQNEPLVLAEQPRPKASDGGLPTAAVSQSPSSPPSSEASTSPAPPRAEPTVLTITDRLLGFGFRSPSTTRNIDTIVIHSSYNASGSDAFNLDKIIGQYEQYGVGAHYLIDRSGKVYRLIREGDVAYHAGESKMPDGRKNVNEFSLGIELMGTEDSGFTGKQYAALRALIADIKTRYSIRDIVGHSDIAPQRKTDPWKFDWKQLGR